MTHIRKPYQIDYVTPSKYKKK